MRYFAVTTVGLLLAVLAAEQLLAQQINNGVNPPGNERRSMGNLRPSTQPNSSGGGTSRGYVHRPWSYGNPPYYRRPPVTPYYVPNYVPYWDRGYGYYVVPWGGQPYYMPPPYYRYPYRY
jgi:hypothetical protein